MIIRVEHRERFTVIANQSLQDRRLSYRATGVLACILSFRDDVALSSERLAMMKSEGRDAIRKALAELESAGYLRRDREQTKSGTWRTICVLQEHPPRPENPSSATRSRGVISHKPRPENPTVGFSGPQEVSTEEQVLGASPWESEGRLTEEQKADGRTQLHGIREAMGWKR